MVNKNKSLAIIPARGGSKGLPGKNIRTFAGLPLIAHAIKLAQSCPEVDRCIVSTDDSAIAQVAREYGGDVPFIRPKPLSDDKTALWPVLQHALAEVETLEKQSYDFVILLDPTTPCRLPRFFQEAFQKLNKNKKADGIIGVSKPDFNPIWHSVIDKDGWMQDLMTEGGAIHRRQDAPEVFRINGSLYIWKADFVRNKKDSWRTDSHLLMYEVPDFAAISIDTEEEFKRAELFVTSGLFPLPWLKKSEVPA